MAMPLKGAEAISLGRRLTYVHLCPRLSAHCPLQGRNRSDNLKFTGHQYSVNNKTE